MKYYPLQQLHKWLNKKQKAFSIIELTIVCALIALIAALCIPSLSLYKQHLLRNEALHLQTTCWYLQQCARAENKQIELVFDENKKSYSGGSEFHKLNSAVKFGTLPHVFGPPQQPTYPIKKAITFPNNTITFYPHGTTSSGSIYLVDEDMRFLYAITIAVGNAPYVRVYNYHNGSWNKKI